MSSMHARPPPNLNDSSAVPSILSWITGILVCLCVPAKWVTKYFMRSPTGSDDVTILVALILSIGMTVSVSLASANGLGKHASNLTPNQKLVFQKSVYATNIIYICCLFFSKLSMLFIFRLIIPPILHKRLFWSQVSLLVLWIASSFFVSAFQCRTPDVWAILGGQCMEWKAFWYFFGAMNILTELCLLGVSIARIQEIHITARNKLTITSIFALRLVVVAVVATELYFIHGVWQIPNEETFTLWPVQVCRLFVQALSIIFACTPFMKPFFAALNSGMTRVDEERRRSEFSVPSITKAVGNAILPKVKLKDPSEVDLHAETVATNPLSLRNVIYKSTTFEVESANGNNVAEALKEDRRRSGFD